MRHRLQNEEFDLSRFFQPMGLMLTCAALYIVWGYANKFIHWPADRPVLYWGMAFFPDCLLVSLLIALAASGKLRSKEYGLVRPWSKSQLIADSVFCYFLFALIIFFLKDLIWIVLRPFSNETVQATPSFRQVKSAWSVPLMAISLGIGSVLEEIVYRGMLLQLVPNKLLYVLVSVSLFAGIHVHQGALATAVAAVVGFVACALYLQFRTLLPLIIAHVGINMTVIAMYWSS